MNEFTYITLRDNPELKDCAAAWFHSKWGVPKDAYLECMESYLNKATEYGGDRFEIQGDYTSLFGN